MRMPDHQVSGEGRYPRAENPAGFNPVLFGFLERHFGHA
jgi:hypothetical protein